MILAEIFLVFCITVVSIPGLVLFFQVLLATLPRRRGEIKDYRPTVTVLVPAHDEAVVIAKTLASILPQLIPGDRLLVVADNCSDDTAKIASQAGAEVITRQDAIRRGKGYALDFGVRHLDKAPTEVLLVVDADCQVTPGSIESLAKVCYASNRPVQSLNLMRAPLGAALTLRIAEFAWIVKNYVRPLGYARIGLPCQLMGTGMAFPWDIIRNTSLASGHLVEDLKLGLDLAKLGKAPMFYPDAMVTSLFPVCAEGIQGQRTRWEHGHLDVMKRDLPKLFLEALRSGNTGLLALVLDLCVPPLALLVLLAMTLAITSAVLLLATGLSLPLLLSALLLAMLGFAVMLSWMLFGRETITWIDLAYAPVYALSKIPLYLKFLVNRQIEWVRSNRDG